MSETEVIVMPDDTAEMELVPETGHRGTGGSTQIRTEPPSSAAEGQHRRQISSVSLESRFEVVGAWLAAIALAWLINGRLLPWSGTLAFVAPTLVLGLSLLAVLTGVSGRGPDVTDRLARAVVHLGALTVGVALVTTIGFIFIRGFQPLTHLNMYVEDMGGVGPRSPLTQGGVAHAVVGSLIEIGIAVIITVPLGIGTAIYMTEIGGRFARIVRTIVEAMTALPSIVAGLFIYTAAISLLGLPNSGLAAALALGVMMLPIIARAADVVLRVVPGNLREAGLALGASRWKTVWNVVLPTARPGLTTAVILGIARGIGETSPVLLTSGNAPLFVTNPTGGTMNSLPLFIFSNVRSPEPLQIERGYAGAAVLLAVVLILFVAARLSARPMKGSR